MIKVSPIKVQENFVSICEDIIKNQQTVIVPMPNGENVVLISEDEYNELQRLAKNCEYLEKLGRSFAEAERGELITKTIEELEEYES